MDEQRLIERAKQGDSIAFDKLLQRYWAKIYRLAFSLVGATLADNVAIKTFETAWQKLNQFRGSSEFGTWLFRIAVRTAYRHLRSPVSHYEETWADFVPDDDLLYSDPEEILRQREDVQQVHWALQQLPLPLREVVMLRFFEDLSYSQIAEVLGCSETAVRKRLAKAIHQLTDLLNTPTQFRPQSEASEK